MEKVSLSRIGPVSLPQNGRIPIVAGIYALGLGLYLVIEPTQGWLLPFVAVLVALGTDGIVRSHPNSVFREALDTAPYLLVPTILTLASGFFLEDTVVSYWTLLAALVAGGLMAAVLYAEYLSVDTDAGLYPAARFVLNVATYLSAFGLYAAMYDFGLGLVRSAFCVGLIGFVLSAEILRETETMPPPVARESLRSLGFAAAIGLIVAEARWALYFVPLDGFLAAVVLLLFFYVASGIVQHYVTGHLSWPVSVEFALVASLGLLMVVLGSTLAGA
ncbi:MAG: hypothetical protein ABR978_07750 [Dehalococcoidia bacterium]